MKQFATNIEQGNRLLEAGIPKESADMGIITSFDGREILVQTGLLNAGTPAWTLSALWDIFHNMDKTYEFSTNQDSGELIETLVRIITFRRK